MRFLANTHINARMKIPRTWKWRRAQTVSGVTRSCVCTSIYHCDRQTCTRCFIRTQLLVTCEIQSARNNAHTHNQIIMRAHTRCCVSLVVLTSISPHTHTHTHTHAHTHTHTHTRWMKSLQMQLQLLMMLNSGDIISDVSWTEASEVSVSMLLLFS